MPSHDQTASLMTPAKLAQMATAKPPASPAAFLDQMAGDVGHQHVARLRELHAVVGRQSQASQAATIQPALERARAAMEGVDFGLLTQKMGFLAGLTGKARSAGAEFAGQVEGAEAALKAMLAEASAVAEAQRAHGAAADRTLVECEVEYRALDRIIEQGARWLQDMRNQLKARHAQANGDPALVRKVEEDAGRCELLVARLKALRAAAAASQQAHQLAHGVAQRRVGLAQAVGRVGTTEVRTWLSTLPPFAKFAADGKTSGSVGNAQDVHQALHKRIGQALTDGAQLRADEQAFGQTLATMGERLAAVG